jgi:serine/threonine-protein kinase
MMDVLAATAGTVLGDRYRVIERLDSGGMGVVYSALELHSGRTVALKVIKPRHANDPEIRERFRREREILERLDHPAIVRVHGSGEFPGGHVYLEMELLVGETLKDRLRREGPFPAGAFIPVLQWIAAAIDATHSLGVIHRDLKPANIFLLRDRNARSPVKVLDFGVSKRRGSKKLTKTGLSVGTPRYMPPEQLSGLRDLDPRVDVYTLGVVTFEAITGRIPYRAKNEADLAVEIIRGTPLRLSEVRADLPPGIETVLAQAMAKARENRYASASDLAEAYALAAADGEMEAPPPITDTLFVDQSETRVESSPGLAEIPASTTDVVGTFPTRPRGSD